MYHVWYMGHSDMYFLSVYSYEFLWYMSAWFGTPSTTLPGTVQGLSRVCGGIIAVHDQ